MFFPIGDDNPTRRVPYVNYGIMALNVLVFLAVNLPSKEGFTVLPQEVSREWGLLPARADWFTFVTSIFLHGDLMHLLGNMLFLWIAGDNVEDKLGHIGFVAFYLISGVLASAAYMLFTKGAGLIPLVGASGAIAGVLGAYMVLFPKAKIRIFYWFYFFLGVFYLESRWFLGIWIAENLFMWLVMSSVYVTGVAYAAHAGGFAVGVIAAILLKGHLQETGSISHTDRATGFVKPKHKVQAEPPPVFRAREYTPPDFISPRTETQRSGEDFFGTEEAIAGNVKAGRLDVAIDKYEDYLKMRHAKPLPGWAQTEIAAELFRQGRYEQSMAAYRRYLAQNPAGADAAEAKFRLGIILSRHRQEYFRAREYLLQATMEHPNPEIVKFAKQELERIKDQL